MSADLPVYPGERTTPAALIALADTYRDAALTLAREGDQRFAAPLRLAALHAIELYLNALMLGLGTPAAEIRGHQHDLASRCAFAGERLRLRRKTISHLHALTVGREYLIVRYAPDQFVALSQFNRIQATLTEVARKVTAALSKGD